MNDAHSDGASGGAGARGNELSELLAKVEAASGSDNPELARDMCNVFVHRDDYPTIGTMITNSLTDPERWQIGTALALVERALPGCDWELKTARHRKGFIAKIFPADDQLYRADGTSAPLAIVAALLKALIAREPAP